MSTKTPQTEISSAKITWDGRTPYASDFGDLYYSSDDPIGEIQHTFLDGVGFSQLCPRPHLAIAETGFGTGLNFLTAWHTWRNDPTRGQTLTFLSVEAYPMATEDLLRAHAPFPRLAPYASALRAQWPGATPGIHRLSFEQGRVRLILMIGEAAAQLSEMRFQADAWFLDGFAPAKNPDMWRDEVLQQIARLSKTNAPLSTFTAAGAVRRGLEAVGFAMSKRSGFGRKRDCLAGHLATPSPPPPHHWSDHASSRRPDRVVVIGDGIAARTVSYALSGAGLAPVRLGGGHSRSYAASTLPRAIIAPKLVRGDQPFPVFWRQAYLDAIRFIDAIAPDSWVGPRGLLIPPTEKNGLPWQSALCEDLNWPARQIVPTTAGLSLEQAGSLDPNVLLNALAPPADSSEDIAAIERADNGWRVFSEAGAVLAEADTVILANGPGAVPLLPGPTDGFGLRVGAGHLRMMRANGPAPEQAILNNGYRTSADSLGIYAVGASVTPRQPLAPVEIADETDAALAARTAPLTPHSVVDSLWSGLRCDTVDHLPLAGRVQDPATFQSAYADLRHGKMRQTPPDSPVYAEGLYAFAGLGSRGFQAAFLLADALAADVAGMPTSLSETIRRAVQPARFQARALVKGDKAER